jgi:predicted xylose isomerase-like sugar epimerase
LAARALQPASARAALAGCTHPLAHLLPLLQQQRRCEQAVQQIEARFKLVLFHHGEQLSQAGRDL